MAGIAVKAVDRRFIASSSAFIKQRWMAARRTTAIAVFVPVLIAGREELFRVRITKYRESKAEAAKKSCPT